MSPYREDRRDAGIGDAAYGDWWARAGRAGMRDLLLLWWDPVGVACGSGDEGEDEYDDYRPQIDGLLREGRSAHGSPSCWPRSHSRAAMTERIRLMRRMLAHPDPRRQFFEAAAARSAGRGGGPRAEPPSTTGGGTAAGWSGAPAGGLNRP